MSEIAVLPQSSRLALRDLDFYVEAVRVQMVRDFAPAWMLEPWPLVPYALIPPAGTYAVGIVDALDVPDALGFHDNFAGLIYGQVLESGRGTSVTLSHEALEMRADPDCSLWLPMPGRRAVAKEVCDAVEGDTYTIRAELMGLTQDVAVSNFILPAWFDLTNTRGPWDFMGKLSGPLTMTPGGYLIEGDVDASGNVVNVANVFAHGARPTMARLAAKLLNPRSRTFRRLTHAQVPVAP